MTALATTLKKINICIILELSADAYRMAAQRPPQHKQVTLVLDHSNTQPA